MLQASLGLVGVFFGLVRQLQGVWLLCFWSLPFVFLVVGSGLGDFVDRLDCELPLLIILSAV